MLLNKSKSKYRVGDSPPPVKRSKQLLYGSASMMLALTIGVAPYAVAKSTNGVIQFDKKEYKVPEMAGHVVLHVERKEGYKGAVKVKFGTISGSAKAPFDYMPQMGELVWENGDHEPKPIRIMIKPDMAKEKQKEEFFVTLLDDPANPTTVDFGHQFQTKVMIMDNEMPPPPPVEPPPPPPPGAGEPGAGDQPPPPPPGEEGPPSVITPGEVAIGTGEQIQLGSLLTSIFSLQQTSVIKSEASATGQIKIVQRVSISRSFKIVKKRKIKVKFKIRGENECNEGEEIDESSNDLIKLVLTQAQDGFGDPSLMISCKEDVTVEELEDESGQILKAVSVPLTNDVVLSFYAVKDQEGNVAVYSAFVTDLLKAAIEANPDVISGISLDGVTYESANGPITIQPAYFFTPSETQEFNVNGALVEGNGIAQGFSVK